MKITIEQEGKEAKVFETNGFILVANFNEHVQCTRLFDDLSIINIADLIHALEFTLGKVREAFPEAANIADIKSLLKRLSEISVDDIDDDKEADNDAGRV